MGESRSKSDTHTPVAYVLNTPLRKAFSSAWLPSTLVVSRALCFAGVSAVPSGRHAAGPTKNDRCIEERTHGCEHGCSSVSGATLCCLDRRRTRRTHWASIVIRSRCDIQGSRLSSHISSVRRFIVLSHDSHSTTRRRTIVSCSTRPAKSSEAGYQNETSTEIWVVLVDLMHRETAI